jgi:hypothetical protein
MTDTANSTPVAVASPMVVVQQVSAATATAAATTPPRPQHGSANPNTPIASIKRPRNYKTSSSSMSSGSGSGSGSNSMVTTPTRTPPPSSSSNNRHSNLSPMHPASAVHRNPHDGIVRIEPPSSTSLLPTNADRDATATATANEQHPTTHQQACADTAAAATANANVHIHACGAAVTTESAVDTASWVGRKVDALFSPVLSFLHSQTGEHLAAPEAEAEALDNQDDGGCPVTIATESSQSGSTYGGDTQDVMMVPSTDEDGCHNQSSPNNNNNHTDSKLVVDDDLDHDNHSDDGDDDVEDDDDGDSHASSMQALQEQCQEDGDEDDFNPWQFIASLPHYRAVQHLTPPVSLPPKLATAPPLTLVLDLDETLVHCTVEAVTGADFEFPVVFHGTQYQVHVRQRPYLKEFLQKIKDKYEVVIFTASQKVYADTLLNQLDPGTCVCVSVTCLLSFVR